jgi:hypothetical protein
MRANAMITDRARYGSTWKPRSLARFVWIKWFGHWSVSYRRKLLYFGSNVMASGCLLSINSAS